MTAHREQRYDLVVVGSGAAGIAASIAGAAEGLHTLVVEREASPGGRLRQMRRVEPIGGMPVGMSGPEFVDRAVAQAVRFGVEFKFERTVVDIDDSHSTLRLVLDDGNSMWGQTIIVATGSDHLQLQAHGLADFIGAGVYFHEPPASIGWLADRDVVLYGAPDRALPKALSLVGNVGSLSVTLPQGSVIDGAPADLLKAMESTPNLTIMEDTQIVGAIGVEHLEVLVLRRRGAARDLVRNASALFVLLDSIPRRIPFGNHVLHDPARGVFLAGDVRGGVVRSPEANAVEGLITARRAYDFLIAHRDARRHKHKQTQRLDR